jgi:hypothetical protein
MAFDILNNEENPVINWVSKKLGKVKLLLSVFIKIYSNLHLHLHLI